MYFFFHVIASLINCFPPLFGVMVVFGHLMSCRSRDIQVLSGAMFFEVGGRTFGYVVAICVAIVMEAIYLLSRFGLVSPDQGMLSKIADG